MAHPIATVLRPGVAELMTAALAAVVAPRVEHVKETVGEEDVGTLERSAIPGARLSHGELTQAVDLPHTLGV
jgi:hypothetical protein